MNVPKAVIAELPDYRDWSEGKEDFDLLDLAMCTATPDLFVAFLEVLEPSLVKYEGEFFLASHFTPDLYHQWATKLADVREIQKVMNHLHMSALFQGRDVADPVAVFLCQRIAAHWNAAFSHKGLKAEALGTSLDDAQVTLYRA